MKTDLHARSLVAEVLAVLRDQKGFDIWWLGMSEEARDDLTEELVEVVARGE